MRRFFLIPLLVTLLAGMAQAAPPGVGEISVDIGYSEGTSFSDRVYTTLEQRHLSDHEGKVIALLYFAPW